MTPSLTALEYVKYRLRNDYKDLADRICALVDEKMKSLVEPDEISGFQTLLNELVCPFLACHKAMQEADMSSEITDKYCRQIWNEIPEEIKQTVLKNSHLYDH